MTVLGIETSGRSGTIAVVHEQLPLAETELSATGRRHARTLVPEIGALHQRLNLELHDLDGIAVSIGPGSFTGLRVGVVCAKTLAYTLKKSLIAIDTFQAIAATCPTNHGLIWVIDDALRGDVYAGSYKFENQALLCQQRPALVSLEEFRNRVTSKDIVTGPGVNKLEEELTGLHLAEETLRSPQASQIALIGEQRLLAGDTNDLWTIEPHYIRRSAAEEKADAKK